MLECCWLVQGGVLGSVRSADRHDFWAKEIEGYSPDMACIVETCRGFGWHRWFYGGDHVKV